MFVTITEFAFFKISKNYSKTDVCPPTKRLYQSQQFRFYFTVTGATWPNVLIPAAANSPNTAVVCDTMTVLFQKANTVLGLCEINQS